MVSNEAEPDRHALQNLFSGGPYDRRLQLIERVPITDDTTRVDGRGV
jgi:hypothetical protein